jgi:5-hydroxyisourate hydrolase-like protein (transthyretin family)
VRIEARSLGEENWRTLSSAVTDVEGKIQKSLILGKSTSIRVFSESSWERSEGISAELPIEILRELFVDAPSSIKTGNAFEIVGTIKPRSLGVNIRVEKQSGKKWEPIGSDITTDAQGNFAVKVGPQSRGVFTFRVTVVEDENWKVVTSPTFNIIIR